MVALVGRDLKAAAYSVSRGGEETMLEEWKDPRMTTTPQKGYPNKEALSIKTKLMAITELKSTKA